MARTRWDDPWQRYPASTPIQVDGGIATTKQRGKMADTWWSKRFIDVLESYGLGTRMQRGRRYARQGQVISLDVNPALVVAQVQGSRRTPYVVTVTATQPSDVQWLKLDDAFRSRVGFVARLLAGEVPPELEEAFSDAGVQLFPRAWRELRATCSCPDDANPCKHIAAVLYVFADQLDVDPWLLLAWRGRSRTQLLEHLGAGAGGVGRGAIDATGMAPWWPLSPGVASFDGSATRALFADTPLAESPDPAHRVLGRLEPLPAEVGGTPIAELLGPAYAVIVGRPAAGDA
jgi:hypothetical protein